MKLRLHPRTALPRLAWIADFDRHAGEVDLLHGASVEVSEGGWVVEGVWDGAFRGGGFDRSAAFFGTGVKVDDHGLVIVPPSAIVDRIVLYSLDEHVVASNSLALLLAYSGAALDQAHNYRREGFAATKGIAHYEPRIRVCHPLLTHVEQHYYAPLLVTRDAIVRQVRDEPPSFADYHSYVAYIERTLAAVVSNARSAERRRSVSLYSTLSAGYDSVAVTALVQPLGTDCVYTSRRSNTALVPVLSRTVAIDDGTPIASALGMRVRYLARETKPTPEHELQFLAPSANEPEFIFGTLAEEIESGESVGVVFMGYHGDKVWDRYLLPAQADDQLKRGDMSGLNLSEIRLEAGFVVAAPAFIGARRAADLLRISNSAEMKPWMLDTDYDRPIPRRIAEEAGVPRSLFGDRKRAVVQYRDLPMNADLRRRFLRYLSARTGWSMLRLRLASSLDKLSFPFLRAVQLILAAIGPPADRVPLRLFGEIIDFPAQLHVWALTELARYYEQRLGGRTAAPSLTSSSSSERSHGR